MDQMEFPLTNEGESPLGEKSEAEGLTAESPTADWLDKLSWCGAVGALCVWVDENGNVVDGSISWWTAGHELRTVVCGGGLVGPFDTRVGAVELLWEVLQRRGVQLRLW